MAEAPVSARSPKGVFAVAAVFALGVVFGVALMVTLDHLGPHFGFGRMVPRHGGGPGGPGMIGHLAKELDLDADQQAKIKVILERTHGTVRETLDAARREIRALLRPDQQEKFDRIRPPGPPPPR